MSPLWQAARRSQPDGVMDAAAARWREWRMTSEDPAETLGDDHNRFRRARTRAASAVGRVRHADRVMAAEKQAGAALQRVRESESVHVARERADDVLERARASEGARRLGSNRASR